VFADLLREGAGSFVDLTDAQVSHLEKHFELLQRWNKVLNLTTIRTVEEIVERHYCESLFLGSCLPDGALRIADVGSGAGFPGIPVAVLRPECSVALIESHKRKSVFLREASRNLPSVCILAERVENVREVFDWAVSRAVAFETIEETVSALADHVALLAGGERPSGTRFTWNDPIQLLWSNRRFLWLGRRVSRETPA